MTEHGGSEDEASREPVAPVAPVEPDASGEPEEPEDPGEPAERRYPSTIGGAFYLLVLVVAGVGIAIAWRGDWRLGIQVVAAALGFAALMRLVLPARDAGMLAVRHRLFDVVLLAALGGLLVFLTLTIPNQPT